MMLKTKHRQKERPKKQLRDRKPRMTSWMARNR